MDTKKNAESVNKKPKNLLEKLQLLWQKLGPGLVTGASDDDPAGIVTHYQVGAQAGFGLLWTAFLTFPLMSSIQEMCGRIGLVTDKGIAAVIKEHYPKWVLYLVTILTVPASILNIGADFAGMGAAANLLVPNVSRGVFILIFAIGILLVLIFFSYKYLESTLKWLALVLLVYLIVPFLVKQDWGFLLYSTFIPHFEFTKEFVALFVALLGTTISPYLFFWEASMESERRELEIFEKKLQPSDKKSMDSEIQVMRNDNNLGMFFANLVMYFVILTSASILFRNGVTNIASVEDAASALRPLAGDGAYLLFAIGVIGTGFLAIPVLAGACAYLLAEVFEWKKGMNSKFVEAKGFYGVIIVSVLVGVGLNILKIDPIQALISTAVIYGVVSPILIAIIIHICNNKAIMGDYTNKKFGNITGLCCLGVMILAIGALVWVSF